jgi:5,10-methylene-tetrahydrofolate dehydrogenase/methenyl tetrahydrofolate cyclohydrolase
MISKCLKSVKLDISTQRFNCKAVSEAINEIVKNNIQNRSAKPKVTVILALGKNRLPNPASEIYVNKKLQVMPQLGIESELIRIDPSITKG